MSRRPRTERDDAVDRDDRAKLPLKLVDAARPVAAARSGKDGRGEIARLRAALRASEERYQALAHAAAPIVWTTPPDGMVEDMPAWRAYTGQTVEQVRGLGWLEAIHPDDRAAAARVWTEAVAARRPLETEYRVQRADGVYRAFMMRAVPVLDAETGAVREWVGVCTDIAERKLAEARSRESEAQLAAELADLQRLQAISGQLIQEHNLDALYAQILDAAMAVMRAEMGSMQMFYPDQNALRLLAWKGFDPASAAFWEWVRVDSSSSCGVALSQGERVLVADVEVCDFMAGTADLDTSRLSGIRAVQSTPLAARDGRLVGMISTHWREPHQPAERELRLLDVLARMAADLIERKQAETAVREADERARAEAVAHARQLETIFEAAADGLIIYDEAGSLVQWNAATAALFEFDQMPDYTGLPVATRPANLRVRDALGQPIPAERLPFMRAVQGETLTGAHAVDLVVTTPSGAEKYVSASAAPLRDDAGRTIGAVTAYRDVTEQRALERRTRDALDALLAMAQALVAAPAPAQERAEERAREIGAPASAPHGPHVPQTMPEPVAAPVGAAARATIQRLIALTQRVVQGQYIASVIVDLDSDALYPLAVVGLTAEIERRWWSDVSGATAGAYMPRPVMERLLTGEVVVLDLAGQPPIPGQDYWDIQTVLVVPVRLDARRLLLLGAEARDRPPFTPQEVELAQAATRLVALVIERERLDRERTAADARELAAREANERMRTFVGIAGHELRTPVTSVRANVQLAERALRASLTADLPQAAGTKLHRAHGLLEGAERQIIRLNRLIEDMLDMTRIASGKLELRLAEDDLGDIVREAVETQRLAWPNRAIELAIADAPLGVPMDADRVGQVVTNFLTNALKYSAADTPVAVAVTCEGAGARVAVRDQGPGLIPAAQAHIWDPFHQVEGIRQQSGSGVGLGLGLHISKMIVEQHGGAVGVSSVVGDGSTFWFTLPLVSEAHTGRTAG